MNNEKEEEISLLNLLFQRKLISEDQRNELFKQNKNEKVKDVFTKYEEGESSLNELADCLQDILTLMQPVKKSLKKRPFVQTIVEFGESVSSDEDDNNWTGESSETEENDSDQVSNGVEEINLEEMETSEIQIPDFGEEEKPSFDIDGQKLIKDPSYTMQKVNEVLEKNCDQKRKRQRRLEFIWDLITGKKPPPIISEINFKKEEKQNISTTTQLPQQDISILQPIVEITK